MMSSEDQATMVQNLQLDDGSDSKDDEAVVSKYFVSKENAEAKGGAQCPDIKENKTGKDSKTKKSKESSTKRVNEKDTGTKKKNLKAKEKNISEKGNQDEKREREDGEKDDAKIFTETDCDNGQNLENVGIDENNEPTELSEQKDRIEYTLGDFESSKSGSDVEKDTDEDMDIYLRNSDSNNEKKQKMAAGDGTEPSHQTLDGSKNKKGGGKENRRNDKKIKLRKRFSDVDTENYRNGYPDKEDDPKLNDNIKFYRGEIPSTPDGGYIDEIHENWMGDYALLERHHGYIQWLFPIRENGMNWQAQALQLHEAEAIKADPKAMKRVLQSYKLILDFYGMNLVDEETGKLERSKNWKMCFNNLNWSSHNYLRITRILKCLGELGYEHLKKGFIQFLLVEALEHKTLTRTLTSCKDYWIGTIKDEKDREELYDYIDSHEGGNSW